MDMEMVPMTAMISHMWLWSVVVMVLVIGALIFLAAAAHDALLASVCFGLIGLAVMLVVSPSVMESFLLQGDGGLLLGAHPAPPSRPTPPVELPAYPASELSSWALMKSFGWGLFGLIGVVAIYYAQRGVRLWFVAFVSPPPKWLADWLGRPLYRRERVTRQRRDLPPMSAARWDEVMNDPVLREVDRIVAQPLRKEVGEGSRQVRVVQVRSDDVSGGSGSDETVREIYRGNGGAGGECVP